MQAPNWTDFLQCSICTCKFDQGEVLPISLSCGHTVCTRCLGKLKTRTCPYDKVAIRPDMERFPSNAALLQLLGYKPNPMVEKDNQEVLKLSEVDQGFYGQAVLAILEVAMFLQPLAEHGITAAVTYLTKPMLKKLVTVVNCQCLENDGQVRAVRAARSIADRMVTELLVMHQNQQQISTLLWTAVRNRGCQFLGPVMQEEALRLILRVLESGNSLSRKNIVLFVVQRLSNDFPQASKTSVGHVVQLLYRASCFNVEKRDDDSSLMQLKEEFRSYECLRREHDGQIIRMAMEAGLRISPEQWSTLLYGDHKHKSDMQSIIDKLISQGAASSGLSELIVAIGRSQDPYQLSEKVVPHLETIFKIPISSDKTTEKIEWEKFATVMEALLAILHGFSTFMQIQNGRFKTGMCPYLSKPGGCPKGERCTYAHSEEERDRFRNLVKPGKPAKPRTGDQFSRAGVGGRRSGDHGPIKALTDSHTPSLNSYEVLPGTNGQHYTDLIRYSGEQLRVGGRPASLTAPVLSSQEWHQIPRGVANLDQNGLTPYLSSEHVYPKPLPTALPSAPTYAVNQPLSNIDLIRLQQQHEAVKQSVDAYSRELIPAPASDVPYRQGEWLNTGVPEGQNSLSSSYSQLTSDHYSLATTEDLMASGSLQHDNVLNQQVLSGLERLDLNGPASAYNSSNSSYPSGYTSPQQPPTSVNIPVCSAPPPPATPTLITTTSSNAASSGEGNASSVRVITSSQDELQAEIERLRKQLREHQQTIQHQSAQLQYGRGAGGVATAGGGGVVQPAPSVTPNTPYPSAQQQVYNSSVGMVIGGDETTHLQAPTPIQYNRQIQAAAAMAAALVSSQANTAQYYPSTAPPPPSATPANTYPPQPHRWSGPQAGGGVTPYTGHAATPNSNYVIQAAGTVPYVIPSNNIARPPQILDQSDDSMLAAYLQIMEQNKAAAGTAAPAYQTTPTYSPAPQGHYYYPRH